MLFIYSNNGLIVLGTSLTFSWCFYVFFMVVSHFYHFFGYLDYYRHLILFSFIVLSNV